MRRLQGKTNIINRKQYRGGKDKVSSTVSMRLDATKFVKMKPGFTL